MKKLVADIEDFKVKLTNLDVPQARSGVSKKLHPQYLHDFFGGFPLKAIHFGNTLLKGVPHQYYSKLVESELAKI